MIRPTLHGRKMQLHIGFVYTGCFFSQFTDNKYCLTLYNMFIYILHNFMHIFIVFISFSLSFIDGLNGSSKWYYCSTALVQALMFVVVKLLPNG